MKKLPHPRTIRDRILCITAGTMLLISLVTTGICFLVFQSFLKKNQFQSSEFSLKLASNNISSDLKDIIYLARWCSSDMEIVAWLEHFEDKEPLAISSKKDKSLRTQSLSAYNQLKEQYSTTRPSKYITRLLISNNTSTNFLQVLYKGSDYSSFRISCLTEAGFFQPLYEHPGFLWIGLVDDPFLYGKGNTPVIPIVRPVYNTFNSDIIGWVYLSVSADLITNYLESYPLNTDSSIFLSIGEQYYLFQDGQLIPYDPDFTTLSQKSSPAVNPGTTNSTIQMADGSKRTLISVPLEQEGWYLHQVLSLKQLNEQAGLYTLLTVAICIIILSLGGIMALILHRTISQPVALVRKKIDDISHGDFSYDETIEWDHEIGDIGKGINQLSRNVVTLMEKRIDDEKQKKDLEYQILQSQINPHFLYNTLNSIKWMATIQGANGISEMTTALARLMKNISKGTNTMITLKEELDLVRDYFLIQQYRYGGSVTIDYQIEEETLYQCRIHRFSLQPIIENALFHGIEPKGCAGKILVHARRVQLQEQTDLEISITDNGIGMSEETIARVLTQPLISQTKADFFRQVGINNVNQRIQYEFGSAYGISIESVLGEYTKMTILIPFIQEEL
ncbi:MAG: sensor histidine kinase [Hungatella sp.]